MAFSVSPCVCAGTVGSPLHRAVRAASSIALAVIVSACDQPAPGPSEVGVLTVEGPAIVAVGEVASFRVMFRTGSETRDVSDVADWRVSPPLLMSIARGTATGLGAGPASVWAVFNGVASPHLPVRVESRIAGDYTLAIGGGQCRWLAMPGDLMNRTYRASVTQQGTDLRLELSGVPLLGQPEAMPGPVLGQFDAAAGEATFDLQVERIGWWNAFDPKVWAQLTEVLPDGSRIEIFGTARAMSAPSGWSGTFAGTFVHSRAHGGSSCESDRHRFELTR